MEQEVKELTELLKKSKQGTFPEVQKQIETILSKLNVMGWHLYNSFNGLTLRNNKETIKLEV